MENKTEQGTVTVDIENKIATIEFFHPSHNSLPGKLLAKLANTITEVGQNDEVVVIILKSAGERTFCAGASFDELISIKDLETGHQFFMGFANVINACRKCPKVIIGRVQGKAVGGGVGIASAVDYCYATRYAAVKLSELAIGIGPFVVGPAVERKVGTSAFSQMAINATAWYSPDWAQQKGLFADVAETAEEMDTKIMLLATTLAKSNPEAQTLLKKVFWEGTEHWDTLLAERASMSGKLVLSDFTVKAINSFKAKA
ncbi:enoyl-CoA hydratase/isomerase family protein [Aureispira anguillae]|uniref:Enoyl-CoA hydratase/isomerase family protein n=1 Tax=Aureispira anguillae TaxID=2864201 RepID=A0A915VKL7_9BACT|nr:enoyl-CoA hydratase/isomerase family protein [Aureispira anguillae]BDS09739.1 enoyl-CoA hydratase/isomerase family protein [Aureispira anguillae]